MNDIMDTLFGSLSKDYCIYFYYLSILGFIFVAIVVGSSLYIGITKGKGVSFYIPSMI